MTLEEAMTILNSCQRGELRDHAFGDREVYWDRDDTMVAEGYFGRTAAVGFYDSDGNEIAEFTGDDAYKLSKCGELRGVSRNDETGPDEYQEGKCMPGLTLEGVKKELCGE